MSTILLIPGAWHGAWCWSRVAPELARAGHKLIAPDLPSMGADQTDPRGITLDSWAEFIAQLIQREAEPVTVVAHSRGGAVASQAAEILPERIRRIVYVAGFMLPTGHSVADAARADVDSLLLPNMVAATRGVTCQIRPEALREIFYGECTPEAQEFALARVGAEPLKPLVTRLHLSEERFGRVARTYIECTRDRAITLAAQRRMQAALPCETVHTLVSDHSPFLSRSEELAGLLAAL